jgi:putative ATP-binding cassette transporter
VKNLRTLPLVRLLREHSRRFDLDMAVFLVMAGLSNAGLLMIINSAAESARNQAGNDRMFALFGVAIVIYVYTQRLVMFTSITEVERILSGIRIRIAQRICRTDLLSLEQVGRSVIYGTISRETEKISQAAAQLVVAAQACVLICFTLVYLAMLSKVAFVLTLGMAWIILILHFRKASKLKTLMVDAQYKENDFLTSLTHLLDGFKEVRLHRARRTDLAQHVREISASVEDVKRRTFIGFASHYIFSQVAFYLALGAIVFLLPRMGVGEPDVVMKLTAALLFIIGPIGMIVNSAPLYSTANVAAANIDSLEQQLERWNDTDENGRPDAEPAARVSRLELRRVAFQYPDHGQRSAFQMGPVDLTVEGGETLFIQGGNGSGKSTLLKILTGLYPLQSGSILLNDTLITSESSGWYRSHFSSVFSDYHLFDRLYGFRDVAPERVTELLKLMRIEDKTGFENGRFTNLDLSTGQRKRLALLVALIEDRPILVLDEWAADQDPLFRKFFYEELLADLKKQGKTIIAATHDDRYFHVADRVVKMEYGQFV